MQTSYTTDGDHTAEEAAAHWKQRAGSWFYLDAVTVRPRKGTGAVAALGDSITDGWHSTIDRNRRWPDYLARRLGTSGTEVKGVANAGIAGNKVLLDGPGESALNRAQRDALSLPGVRTVFLFQGVNDIKAEPGATSAGLIAGYRRLIDRAHAAGKCVVGATIAPYKGWQEWDPAGEAVRQRVNAFIRDSGEFDGSPTSTGSCAVPTTPSGCSPPSTAATICTPTTRACRRWPTPSICAASTAGPETGHQCPVSRDKTGCASAQGGEEGGTARAHGRLGRSLVALLVRGHHAGHHVHVGHQRLGAGRAG